MHNSNLHHLLGRRRREVIPLQRYPFPISFFVQLFSPQFSHLNSTKQGRQLETFALFLPFLRTIHFKEDGKGGLKKHVWVIHQLKLDSWARKKLAAGKKDLFWKCRQENGKRILNFQRWDNSFIPSSPINSILIWMPLNQTRKSYMVLNWLQKVIKQFPTLNLKQTQDSRLIGSISTLFLVFEN